MNNKKSVKYILHKYFPENEIAYHALVAKSDEVYGWMLKHGYTKKVLYETPRVKKGMEFFSYELTEKGRKYVEWENKEIIRLTDSFTRSCEEESRAKENFRKEAWRFLNSNLDYSAEKDKSLTEDERYAFNELLHDKW